MPKSFTGLGERCAPIAGRNASVFRAAASSLKKEGYLLAPPLTDAKAALFLPSMFAGTPATAGRFAREILGLRRHLRPHVAELSPENQDVHSFFASFIKAAPEDILAANANIMLLNWPVTLIFSWGENSRFSYPPRLAREDSGKRS